MHILSLQKLTINSSSQKREVVNVIRNVDVSALTNLGKDESVLTNPGKMGYDGLICKHNESFFLGLFGSIVI